MKKVKRFNSGVVMNYPAARRTTGYVLGLVLLLTASSFAQQIPFDYFYGRIIGRQQVILDYYDREGGQAFVNGDLYFGFRDHFRFGVDRLFTWTPNLADGALRWNEPPLRGDVQLTNELRLHHSLADFEQSHNVVLTENQFYHSDLDGAVLQQSLNLLENAGVEYNPDLSLYYYLKGLWLNHSRSRMTAAWDIILSSQNTTNLRSLSESISLSETTEQGNDRYSLSAGFEHGVTQRLQLGLLANLSLRNRDSWTLSQRRELVDAMSTRTDLDTLESNEDDVAVSLRAEAKHLLSTNAWISAEVAADLRRVDSERRIARFREDEQIPLFLDLRDADYDFYTFAASSDWISGRTEVPYQQILDNFQGYYGKQLPAKTVHLATSASFRYNENRTDVEAYRDDLLERSTQSKGFNRSLHFDFSGRYYLLPNLNAAAQFVVDRQQVENSRAPLTRRGFHAQTNSLKFLIDYTSSVWQADQRGKVGWENISDIDYLLGAMLLPGDFRISADFQPPTYQARFYNEDVSLLNFFRGDDDGDWHTALRGAVGIGYGVEVNQMLSYQSLQRESFSDQPYWEFIWTSTVKAQPSDFARVGLQLQERFYRDIPSYLYSDDHTWSVDVRLDIVI